MRAIVLIEQHKAGGGYEVLKFVNAFVNLRLDGAFGKRERDLRTPFRITVNNVNWLRAIHGLRSVCWRRRAST
jgi:hypothetical protein